MSRPFAAPTKPLTYEAFEEWWKENGGQHFIGCDRWGTNPMTMAWKAWEEARQRETARCVKASRGLK